MFSSVLFLLDVAQQLSETVYNKATLFLLLITLPSVLQYIIFLAGYLLLYYQHFLISGCLTFLCISLFYYLFYFNFGFLASILNLVCFLISIHYLSNPTFLSYLVLCYQCFFYCFQFQPLLFLLYFSCFG